MYKRSSVVINKSEKKLNNKLKVINKEINKIFQ